MENNKKKEIQLGGKQIRKGKYSVSLTLDNIDWGKTQHLFTPDRIRMQNKVQSKPQLHSQIGGKELLKILAAGSVIALSIVAPAALIAFGPLLITREKFSGRTLKQSMDRLRRQKLVSIEEEHGTTVVKITEAGRVRALRYKLDEMAIQKPKRWDRKWRIIIFDIPERYKRKRELMRDYLRKLGCKAIQKSVYVHPYPCFDEIEYLRQLFHVGVSVTYIVAERVEGDKDLQERFEL